MKIKTLLIGAAFAALSLSGHATEKKKIPEDKRLHAGASFFIGVAAAHQWPNEPLKAFGVAMLPGLAKEVLDSRGGTGFSGKDIAANAIGAALGVATGNWIVSRNNGTTVVAYRTEF
jgi:hypothetical protein